MVKILISEDNDKKLAEICEFIRSLEMAGLEILTAKTMAEFSSKLEPDVAVCVIDIRIPAYDGGNADQNGLGILQHIESSANTQTQLLAISSYPEEFEGIRPNFERLGCVLADFAEKDIWQSALKTLIVQSKSQEKFDFLIFAALRKERAPYTAMTELEGQPVSRDGINRLDVRIGKKSGAIIELPRMGVVDAAIFAAKYIDRYTPTLVAMSGICAGFSDRAELGQLLVAEISYEYQTGKWTDDGFESEPYQSTISQSLRTVVREIIEDEGLVSELENGWRKVRPSTTPDPKLAIFTSGSAVIASESYMDQISQLHRKVSGLDMEIFGVHRASQLAEKTPDVLCAKVVVDLANSSKDDKIQDYGCFVSSRFIVKAIKRYFNQ